MTQPIKVKDYASVGLYELGVKAMARKGWVPQFVNTVQRGIWVCPITHFVVTFIPSH